MRLTEVDIHQKVKDICGQIEGCVENKRGDFEIKIGDDEIFIDYFNGSDYTEHFNIRGWNLCDHNGLTFDFFTPDDIMTEEELLFLELRHKYNVKFVNHETFIKILEDFRDGKHELLTKNT
jgi:hypothetical protein